MKYIFLLPLLFFHFCSQPQKDPQLQASLLDSLKSSFKNQIIEKNNSFINEEWSPLKEEDKHNFKGLKYFPYDIKWRFSGPIVPYANPEKLEIIGSKHGKGRDDIRPAEKYGYFEFEYEGQKQRLQIIKILPRETGGESHLFLGFWDETSGEETYGGGRYIDLEQAPTDKYIVDFNFAYNPYCAYSDRYSCAIPPFENRLNLKITAGEKIYGSHH